MLYVVFAMTGINVIARSVSWDEFARPHIEKLAIHEQIKEPVKRFMMVDDSAD